MHAVQSVRAEFILEREGRKEIEKKKRSVSVSTPM